MRHATTLRLQSGILVLGLVFLCLGYVLLAVGVHVKTSEAEDRPPQHPDKRGRRLSRHSEESDYLALAVGAQHGDMGLAANALHDTEAMRQLRRMEAHRQRAYLDGLRKRGQVLRAADGADVVVSSGRNLVYLPNTIKNKDVDAWSEEERVWINLTHFPWSDDDACKDLSVRFSAPHSLPPVGLASYPSSGNTWLRYLVETASGIFTGSFYDDVVLKRRGFYGECVPYDAGMTVVVKSHGHTTGKSAVLLNSAYDDADSADDVDSEQFNHIEELGRKAVLLIRSPYKAIVGHRHLDAGGHTGYAKEQDFQGQDWDDFVSAKIHSWQRFYLDWLDPVANARLLVVHFENLEDRLESTLRQVNAFVGLPMDERRLRCVLEHQEGSFRRKRKDGKSADSNVDHFSKVQKAQLDEAIARVNEALVARGLQEIPLQKYHM